MSSTTGTTSGPLGWRSFGNAEGATLPYQKKRSRQATHSRTPAPNGPRPGAVTRRGDTTATALLALGLMTLYVGISRRQYVAYDASSMMAVTTNLVLHFSLRTTGAFGDYLHLSTPWSPYGPGLSFLAAPLYALSRLANHESMILSLLNPAVTAATCGVVLRIARRLGWPLRRAFFAAASYGVLTTALQATTELFSEPAVTLCTAVVVLGLLQWRDGERRGPWTAGIAAAAAIQFRSDCIVTLWVAGLALPLFVPWRAIVRRNVAVALGLPVAVSLGLFVWYNEVRYHALMVSSYGGVTFSTPLGTGLRGLLLSPGKSVFVYSPLTLLGAVGVAWLVARREPIGVLFALLIVTRVLFFARWGAWEGGVCWGPRFLFPTTFMLVLGAFALLDVGWRAVLRRFVTASLVTLAAVSAPIAFLSVRVPYEQWFDVAVAPNQRAVFAGDGVLSPSVTNVGTAVHDLDFTTAMSPIRGNVLLLQHHLAQVSPAFWRDGQSVAGWCVVASAFLLMAVGARASWRVSIPLTERAERSTSSS